MILLAGISSRKIASPYEWDIKNNYLYNDKPFFDEGGLNWYNYGFRYYDAQIGRFPQLDPLTWDYPMLTPYQYASCEPIANVDLDGLEAASVMSETLSEVVVSAVRHTAKALKSINWLTVGTGALKVLGGSLEIVGGGAYIVGSGGAGAILGGGLLVAHGADNVQAGLREIFSGVEAKTFTEQGISAGLQKAGVSQGTADQIGSFTNDAIGAAFGLKGASLIKFGGNLLKVKPPSSAVKTAVSGKGSVNAFRYMSLGELKAVQRTGLLRGGRSGETFFTKDLYKSAANAQNRLALPSSPQLRVEFQILNKPRVLRNGVKTLPANGMTGKGAEFMTLDPVKVKLINWQPLR